MGRRNALDRELVGQKPTEPIHGSDPRVYIPSSRAILLEGAWALTEIALIHTLNKYLLRISYKADTVLGSEDIAANNPDKNLCFHAAYILV